MSLIIRRAIGNDVVPRFGLGTSEDLRDAILRLCRDADLSYLQDMSAASEEHRQRLADMMNVLRDEVMVHEKLYPPGRVIHINPGTFSFPFYINLTLKGRKFQPIGSDGNGLAEKLVDNGCFSEIIISADMFKVHMPGPYLEACNRLT